MTISIYNTMTREKESFISQKSGEVKMYVCGPTVYGYMHIGNARPAVFFDVVRRYLEACGYEVNYIMNFTDVDDKLIKKAHDMNLTVPEVADMFVDAYYEDCDALGVHRATTNPRVTENMAEIIAFISKLVEQDIAYESGGDVFFRTNKFAEYGKLSHQNLDELQFGIRIEVDVRKESAADFVLWKAAKPGEIAWPSPWGEGRPGWHIECSAMAHKYLGDTIDIHGGGQDLTFPHHECELAQSESVTGKPLANYWMHNGYINMNNEKMSKSLGNGVLMKDLRTQYDPGAIRYFMLSTHYRNSQNFSGEAMQQAINSIERLHNAVDNVKYALSSLGVNVEEALQQPDAYGEPNEALQTKLASILELFDAKMSDDFNTADAISAMFEWVTEANVYVQQRGAANDLQAADLIAILDAFEAMNDVLGLVIPRQEELLDEEIEQLIQERTDARKAKNWASADEIRDLLTAKGIVLEDTPQGVRWKRG